MEPTGDNRQEQWRALARRAQWPALIAGALGLAGCVAGWLVAPDQLFGSYLLALQFWLGISLGSLAITMLYHLVGGSWGYPVRRVQEAAGMLLALLALLFLPLPLLGMAALYPWARPAEVAADPLLQAKQPYLNVPFFAGRAALYFAIWIGLAALLNRWSLRQDQSGDPALERRMRDLSRFGLVLYMLTVTFASIDWVMSLEPHWYSTIYGLIYVAGQGLSGFAFAILAAGLLARRSPLAGLDMPARFGDLGGLLLTFVMFWGYVTLSQYLLIWSGNLPEEVTWYVGRSQGGWSWVILAVLGLQFVLPFLLLLARRNKRSVRALTAVAALILAVHLLELFWLIMPPLRPAGLSVYWTDIAAPVGVGGVWVAAFAWLLASRPLLAPHDPRSQPAQEAIEHG